MLEKSILPIKRLTQVDQALSQGAFKSVGPIVVARRDEVVAGAAAPALLDARRVAGVAQLHGAVVAAE